MQQNIFTVMHTSHGKYILARTKQFLVMMAKQLAFWSNLNQSLEFELMSSSHFFSEFSTGWLVNFLLGCTRIYAYIILSLFLSREKWEVNFLPLMRPTFVRALLCLASDTPCVRMQHLKIKGIHTPCGDVTSSYSCYFNYTTISRGRGGSRDRTSEIAVGWIFIRSMFVQLHMHRNFTQVSRIIELTQLPKLLDLPRF